MMWLARRLRLRQIKYIEYHIYHHMELYMILLNFTHTAATSPFCFMMWWAWRLGKHNRQLARPEGSFNSECQPCPSSQKNNKVSVQNFLSIEMQEQFFLCRAATQLMHAIKMYSVRTICGTLTEKQFQGHLGHSSQRPVCLPPGLSSEKNSLQYLPILPGSLIDVSLLAICCSHCCWWFGATDVQERTNSAATKGGILKIWWNEKMHKDADKLENCKC